MDVVPYVTKVENTLSAKKANNWSVYNRSTLGHYAVYIQKNGNTTNYEQIKLYGYNLGNNTVKPEVSDNKGNTASVGTVTKVEDSELYMVPVTLTNAFKSGEVNVKVSGINLLNNKNNNDATGNYSDSINATFDDYNTYCYNRQPNNDNNNLLTDDLVFDVWFFNSQAARPISGLITDPVMKINPASGELGFAFTNGPLYWSMPGYAAAQTANRIGKGNNSYAYWAGSYDFIVSTGFAYDQDGRSYGCAAGGDINETSADNFNFFTDNWGIGASGTAGTYDGSKANRLEKVAQKGADGVINFDKNRVVSPSFAIHKNSLTSKDIYLAYFDHLNGEIRFRAGTLTTINGAIIAATLDGTTLKTNNNTDNGNKMIYLHDADNNIIGSATTGARAGGNNNRTYALTNLSCNGTVAGYSVVGGTAAKSNFSTQFQDSYTNRTVNNAGNLNSGAYSTARVQVLANENGNVLGNSGEYVSIGVTSNNTVVMAWFDGNDLKYSYNKTPLDSGNNGVAQGTWANAKTLIKDAGEYCQLVVDGDNGVHIAAFDSINGDLVYAYLPSADCAASDIKTCIVDSYLSVGNELTIDVAKVGDYYIPYIGYFAAYPKLPHYAYLNKPESDDLDGVKNDQYTGVWECKVVPSISKVKEDRMNIGVWKDASGVIKNSVTGTNNAGQYYGTCYGNGTNNGVMAYSIAPTSTQGYIETAQMQ